MFGRTGWLQRLAGGAANAQTLHAQQGERDTPETRMPRYIRRGRWTLHVIATRAEGPESTPVRCMASLQPGQAVRSTVPGEAGKPATEVSLRVRPAASTTPMPDSQGRPARRRGLGEQGMHARRRRASKGVAAGKHAMSGAVPCRRHTSQPTATLPATVPKAMIAAQNTMMAARGRTSFSLPKGGLGPCWRSAAELPADGIGSDSTLGSSSNLDAIKAISTSVSA